MNRCWWCGTDPLYVEYHDAEWGKPVTDDRRLFEKVCLEGFQAGLSWLTILRKRENFRRAFANFDIDRVARYTARDVTRLLGDEGIIRHRGKIESTINNAKRAIELREECGSLSDYFWRWEPDPADAAAADHARDSDGHGDHTRVHRAQQGSAQARLDVRRPDDDLRLHAGDGPGERPRRGLRLQRSDSWTDCRTRWNASSYDARLVLRRHADEKSSRPSLNCVVVSETDSRWPVTSETFDRVVRSALRPLIRSRV